MSERRLQRLLPDSWQGDGREARWRRSRARRVLAGLLCGVAVLAVVGAVRPADPPTHSVAVAARDLPAGSRLTADDVREVRWSTADRVPGRVSVRAVPGTILTAPILAGEPFTSARVRSARTWPSVPAGRVVVGVSTGDTAITRVLQAGDRVDLIDTGKGATIAVAVPVLAVIAETAAAHGTGLAGGSSAEAPAVLVAVTPSDAAAVGSASAARSGGLGGGIQLALRAAV
ncbi:SAF domain-containing protein [Flexivirga oryzae]|uniref:Flp pilus assembly protein CpaB n=1 Tax=Flexivirga oryzae TaxID=1794944 RepID=A0A839NBV2_9MICO|nr:SAF domain-containing protein [Flexivirga oryzae]MBB2892665.1 Flp pilus assembly protein CpaB [Flexivirga oryzae]